MWTHAHWLAGCPGQQATQSLISTATSTQSILEGELCKAPDIYTATVDTVLHCKDDMIAGRTKSVKHTCPRLLKIGEGEILWP